jgi:predicted dehydrogenase
MTAMLGVGVLGTNTWARLAHLPAYAADERVRLVSVCDVVEERAREAAEAFGAQRWTTDPEDVMRDPEVAVVDVCTPTDTHLELSLRAIHAGKHVLSEKPLARDAAGALDAARRAEQRGVRTKTGFTFRYAPAMRQLKRWVEDGTLGEVFHVHGLEQNAQFLDPDVPLRQVPPSEGEAPPLPSSIVGYGSHLVDLMRWVGGEFEQVVGSMHTFVPERAVRGQQGRQRVPIEDGTVAQVEFASGAQGMLQTSIVAVGNYPGVEVRVYGSRGAAVARLVEEGGVMETLHRARADAVEFEPVALPASAYPPGTDVHTPWPELYYRNLIRHFVDEILERSPADCTFADGAESQRIVDAIVRSHRTRVWQPVHPRS